MLINGYYLDGAPLEVGSGSRYKAWLGSCSASSTSSLCTMYSKAQAAIEQEVFGHGSASAIFNINTALSGESLSENLTPDPIMLVSQYFSGSSGASISSTMNAFVGLISKASGVISAAARSAAIFNMSASGIIACSCETTAVIGNVAQMNGSVTCASTSTESGIIIKYEGSPPLDRVMIVSEENRVMEVM